MPDTLLHSLDTALCAAVAEELRQQALHPQNPTHPARLAAEAAVEAAVAALLQERASTPEDLLVKLRLALRNGEYEDDLASGRPSVASRALFSLFIDLDHLREHPVAQGTAPSGTTPPPRPRSTKQATDPTPDPSQVGRLCAELLDLYRRDTGGMTDDERDAFLDRRDRLTWLLTQLPAQTPAHTAAKLTILCHRLRHELDPGCVPMPVTDYLLAESARGDVESAVE